MSAWAVNLASSSLAGDGLFRSALEASPDCVKILDLSGTVQFVNRNGVAIMGARDAAELLGRCWPALWDEPQRATASAAVNATVRGGVQRFAAPGRVFTGDVRHFDNVLSPLRDEAGECIAVLVASRDVTELEEARLAAEAVKESLERTEQRLLLAAQLAGMRVYEVDFAARTVTNHGWAPSISDREPTYDDIWPIETNRFVDIRDRDRVSAEWRQAVQEGRPLRSEFRVTRTDGQERWAYCVAELVRDTAGQPLRVLAAIVDITDRKRSEIRTQRSLEQMRKQEAHQKLLLGELNHRVKNTLASVQSVVMQTLRDTPDVVEARELLLDRLMALSATHNLLVKTAWESASFRDLIDTTLSPYGRPYAVTGPDLRLDPNFAISLGMALHELTMNALKHGAWKGAGRVDIDVEVRGPEVTIVWQESGGPPVTPPTRRGFGSRLLERGVAAEVHGEIRLDFRPDGLVCIIRAPLCARLQVMRR